MAETESARRGPASSLVADVVSEAIDRAGKALALARKIQPLIGREYADRTVSAWGRGDVMPPADAVLAAAQVTGVSLDEKLGIGRAPTALETQVAVLQDQVEQQRSVSAAMAQRLEELSARLAGASAPTSPQGEGTSAELPEAERVLIELEAHLLHLGRRLGRRWDDRMAYSDPASPVSERVARRIGRIEARIAEVGVLAPAGGYPPRPSTADQDAVRNWVYEEIPVLRRQLALVEERVRRFDSSSDAVSDAQ